MAAGHVHQAAEGGAVHVGGGRAFGHVAQGVAEGGQLADLPVQFVGLPVQGLAGQGRRAVAAEDAGDFHTAVTLNVKSGKGTLSMTATLFGGGRVRITEIDGVPIEAALTPNMLLIRNQDKPGLIGGAGTILSEAGVNIADFRLGRRAEGGAIALVSVDQAVDDATFEKLAALPQAESVIRLNF